MSHRLSLMALTLPEVDADAVFPVVPPQLRHRLTASDLHDPGQPTGRQVAAHALRTVLDEIESRHSSNLRRRREKLFGSLKEWLAGRTGPPARSTTTGRWPPTSPTASAGGVPRHAVSTRTKSDLQELDRLRRSVSSGRNGWAHGYLLHEARLQDPTTGV